MLFTLMLFTLIRFLHNFKQLVSFIHVQFTHLIPIPVALISFLTEAIFDPIPIPTRVLCMEQYADMEWRSLETTEGSLWTWFYETHFICWAISFGFICWVWMYHELARWMWEWISSLLEALCREANYLYPGWIDQKNSKIPNSIQWGISVIHTNKTQCERRSSWPPWRAADLQSMSIPPCFNVGILLIALFCFTSSSCFVLFVQLWKIPDFNLHSLFLS